MDTYKYTSLSGKDSIRLMTLQPGRKGDDLYCSLSEVSLQEAPEYEALSYVWGDPTMTESICCDGSQLYITDTLKVALQRLRLPNSPRVLWIDQICIDQSAIDEKSHQVKLMASIYGLAREVIMWLGDASDLETRPAFSLMRKFFANVHTKIIPYLNIKGDIKHPLDLPTNNMMADLGLPPRDSPEWDAFAQLIQQSYFTRVWVIQESRVAKSAKLLWGNCDVDWRVFWRMVTLLIRIGCLQSYQADRPRSRLDLENILILVPKGLLESEGPESLLDLLWNTQHRKATDPRDRVFALLGLHTDLSNHELSFEANYRKSTIEVYQDLARFSISHLPRLDVLSYVFHVDSLLTSGSPSWCPRWDRNTVWGQPLSVRGFKASAGKEASLGGIEHNPDTLSLHGVEVTSVESISLLTKSSINHEWILYTISDCWKRVAQKLPDPYNGKPLIQSFVSTLTTGTTLDPVTVPGKIKHLLDYVAYFSAVLADMTEHPDPCRNDKICPQHILDSAVLALELAKNLGERSNSHCLPSGLKDISKATMRKLHPRNEIAAAEASRVQLSLLEGGGDPIRFLASLCQGYIGTENFFLTKSGLMGRGPRVMESGDIVAVLYGGQVPYILRPTTDGHFLFVGACYVEGLMNGEAIDMLEEGNLEAQIFTLV